MEKLFCSRCKEEKYCSEFNKDNRPNRKRGHQPYCRICEKERKKTHDKEYYQKTIEYQKERYREYAKTDNGREAIRRTQRKNYPKHKKRYLANWAKRKAAKLQACLNYDKYKDEIEEIYKNCPSGHHVDHIIPLQGKNVRGFHVPWNLQYLTKEENLKKGNRIKEESNEA